MLVVQYRSICVLYRENLENCICFKEYLDKKLRYIHSANENCLPFFLLKEYENELLRQNSSMTYCIALQFNFTVISLSCICC